MNSVITKATGTLAALAILALAGAASAADYPTKAVTLISPYGPGGAADLAARTLANAAPQYLGEEIIVTNRTGAAGVTGSTFVAKGRPDGYTLLLARVGSQAAVPAINQRIPYKWDEFTFLGLLETNPFVLVVNADSPYQSFEDLQSALNDGTTVSYASAGVGTLLHIAMVMLFDDLGVDPNAQKHIPYKGGGKAAAAVTGGHVDMMFQNLSGVIGGIESGQLKPLLITSKERFDSLPEVPTAAELGYPKLETVVGWSALYGPPNLPEPIVATWVEVLGKLKDDNAWIEQTEKLSSIPNVRNPEDTKAFVQNQYESFQEVVERLNLTIK